MEEKWVPFGGESKVLTLANVTEMIAITKVPEGEISADEYIVQRIDDLCSRGYSLTEDAATKVDRLRKPQAPAS